MTTMSLHNVRNQLQNVKSLNRAQLGLVIEWLVRRILILEAKLARK
jgi:hypothetical protein